MKKILKLLLSLFQKPVRCCLCNQPITEVGTAIDGRPSRIRCYHFVSSGRRRHEEG